MGEEDRDLHGDAALRIRYHYVARRWASPVEQHLRATHGVIKEDVCLWYPTSMPPFQHLQSVWDRPCLSSSPLRQQILSEEEDSLSHMSGQAHRFQTYWDRL